MSQKDNRVFVIDPSILTDEVFSFMGTDRGTTECYHFNATKIRAHIEAERAKGNHKVAPFTVVDVSPEHIAHVEQNNGVEVGRLAKLAMRPDIYCQPVLLADMGHYDGKDWHVMIDGNHRSVLLYKLGLRKIGAYMVPRAVWSKFLIDMPTDPDFMADWIATPRGD